MLRIAAQPARRLPGFRQHAAQVPHRARSFGGFGAPRCVARIPRAGAPAAGSALRPARTRARAGRSLDTGTRPLGEEFHLYPQERVVPEGLPAAAIRGCYLSRDPIRLLVVDKQAGGAADALNAGVNAAQYPVIGLVDPEADFIPELLLRLIRPMLGDWEGTIAVCGVAPPPPARGLAGCIGAIESLRLWLARCAAFSAWNRLLPVPGACMLVKREAVRSVGGFRAGALELFLDLHAAARATASPARVAFLASPVSCRPAAGDVGRFAWPGAARSAATGGCPVANGRRRRPRILRTVLLSRTASAIGNCRLYPGRRRLDQRIGSRGPGGAGAGDGYRYRNGDLDGGRRAA